MKVRLYVVSFFTSSLYSLGCYYFFLCFTLLFNIFIHYFTLDIKSGCGPTVISMPTCADILEASECPQLGNASDTSDMLPHSEILT